MHSLDDLQRGLQFEAFLSAALGTLLVELVITTMVDAGVTSGNLAMAWASPAGIL